MTRSDSRPRIECEDVENQKSSDYRSKEIIIICKKKFLDQ